MSITLNDEQTNSDEKAEWFVMTTPDPKRIEELLLAENIQRYGAGIAPIQYFVPYQFLKRRVANENPADDDASKSADYQNPKSRLAVKTNNEIRSSLRRYIFIKECEANLVDFLSTEENAVRYRSLWFYTNKKKERVKVPERMMKKFIEACTDERLKFEIWPSVQDLEKNEEVILNTTPFKGEKVRVLEVKRTSSGTVLTVGFHIFAGDMLLKLPNLSDGDILRKATAGQKTAAKDRIVENTQRRLLSILSRRQKGGQTEQSVAKDMAALDEMSTYRYHSFTDDAARRHFLALMLICTHLRHDRRGTKELVAEALTELETIAKKPAEKAATDVRTYLQIALYVATGNPEYRTQAKAYVRDHQPESEALRRFVRLMKQKRIK